MKDISPKISVIVPVYNAGTEIARCVDSILGQTFTDFELLLVDDGSTDGSSSVCDEYASADERVVVFHKDNGGASSSRNLGIDNARGEWIAFCDADDFVDCIWLECLAQHANEDCDLISCGFHFYKSDESSSEMYPNIFVGGVHGYLTEILSGEMFGSLCNKLFKASIITRFSLRLDNSIKFREDEEFVLRYLAYCTKCRTIPKALYHYYMPRWNKYNNQAFDTEVALYLLTRLFHSLRVIGYRGSFTRKLRNEMFRVCLANIRRHPFSSYKYIKNCMVAYSRNHQC